MHILQGLRQKWCVCDKRRRQGSGRTQHRTFLCTCTLSDKHHLHPSAFLRPPVSLCTKAENGNTENTDDTGWRQRNHRYSSPQMEEDGCKRETMVQFKIRHKTCWSLTDKDGKQPSRNNFFLLTNAAEPSMKVFKPDRFNKNIRRF